MLKHVPHSTDLHPCDFFLFPELKSLLKGPHFQSTEDILTAQLLKAHFTNDFRECFKAPKAHKEWCIAFNGNSFPGHNNITNKVNL
jgi:hypothetical protein